MPYNVGVVNGLDKNSAEFWQLGLESVGAAEDALNALGEDVFGRKIDWAWTQAMRNEDMEDAILLRSSCGTYEAGISPAGICCECLDVKIDQSAVRCEDCHYWNVAHGYASTLTPSTES